MRRSAGQAGFDLGSDRQAVLVWSVSAWLVSG